MINNNSKRIFLSPPRMSGGEFQLIQEAFESNYIAPLGPMVDAFEKEFADRAGIRHALALSSGTAAMHLALRHLGIGPGDEVFASDLTFIGSVTPIIFEGATPVFIDSDRFTWNMDPNLLAFELEKCAKRGRLPRAVIPTDIYGQCADYGQIFYICEKYGVPVIIDAAEAIGSAYSLCMDEDSAVRPSFRHAGFGGKAAIYSFNGNKILTCAGGGMLASDDKDLIDHARKLSQQARENFPYYEHEEIGYNYRMSNILAAIGLGQLRSLDERVDRKREIFEYYRQALDAVPGIEFMPEAFYGKSNRWLTAILITPEEFGADCETVRLALEANNIESRPLFKPLHLQPVFQGHRLSSNKSRQAGQKKKYYSRTVGGEVAEDLFSRGLCLPSDTAMNEEDINRVVNIILNCRNRKKDIDDRAGIYLQAKRLGNFHDWMKARELRLAVYNSY
jgi:dTDP-4-amino-4,6-dideoxygalactose transaminase